MAALQRVPLEEITREARQVQFAQTLARSAAFLLICLGRFLGWCWLVPVWCFLAVREGWRDVHPVKDEHGKRARAG